MKPNVFLASIFQLLKITLLVGVIAWLSWTFPLEDWFTLKRQNKNWWVLTQALVVVLIAHLISYWRWMLFLNALDIPIRWIEAIRLGFLGTLLNQVSIGSVGGDLFKAIEAARKSDGKRTEVVASVLVDRAVGLLGLVLVASIGLAAGNHLSKELEAIKWGAVTLSAIGLSGLISIVLLGRRLPVDWIASIPIVGNVFHRLVKACMVFQGRPRLVLELVGSSMLVHVGLTLSCFLISKALYPAHPTLQQHFMVIPPAVAAATLPLTPGGLGLQEAAIKQLFDELPDLPTDFSPLIIAAVFRMFLLCITFIGAIYYMVGLGDRKRIG